MHAQHWDFGWKKLGGQKIFDSNTLLVHSVHGRLNEALRLHHLLQSGFIGLGLGLSDGLAALENLQKLFIKSIFNFQNTKNDS